MVFIVGTSGSGKSTLLNMLGGLDAPDSGFIIINGTDISHLKKNEYASYRNTYVGFIFQEFNVLENLTVRENIEISLKLQDVQDTNSEVDNILKKLKIDDLKNRRMNELSGGQKQRVAIARALIKKPNIILADEPTGNLDSTNTKQIFDILKEISKDYLVIVVSHDKEAALKYADHTIQLEDGKVVSNDYKEEKNKEDKINFINSKLPNFYKFKLALNNLKTKPFKLIITIILLSMAFAFMEFTINMALFDEKLFLVNTMKDNKNYNYRVYKYEEIGNDGENTVLPFDENDIEKIRKITNKNASLGYYLFDSGERLSFEFEKIEDKNAYFSSTLQYINFVELKDDNLIENNIIGSIPKNSNDILVHKYFADCMIEFGIKLYDNTIYKPSNYSDIISDKKEIKLGSNKVVISGIIDDDNKNYLKYKNKIRIHEDDDDYKKLFILS